MERLYAGQQLHRQKLVHAEELFTADQRRKAALAETAAAEKRRADEARAKDGSARMPPVLRRKYAGRQNRHAVRQKRNV